MDLFSKFKKDYFNYLISIIVPMAITAGSIPLFKLILGSEGYGNFSITFNGVLLCTATLTGWITQSVIRYFPFSTNKHSFAKITLQLSFRVQALFFLPVLVVVYLLKHDLLLAIFFSVALFATSMQFSIIALSQSFFLSRKSIFSELIRTVSYIILALLLLKLAPVNYMYSLFTAIIVSYLLSFLYLHSEVKKQHTGEYENDTKQEKMRVLLSKFLRYGAPLSLWFLCSYLISLVDKVFMLKMISGEVQGNYQAMFDLLSKSITVFISPIVISMFPLLTSAHQKGETGEIRKLLKRIIGFEFGCLILASLLYWWFGSDILFAIIKTPATPEYKLMGLMVIIGAFLWQMAVVVHKRYELKFKSKMLLGMVILALLAQLALYMFLGKPNQQLLYPVGYMLASFVYLFLVSFTLMVSTFKRFSGK